MKPFGGGLLGNASLVFRYLMQFDGIVPDPGIEKLSEIEEIVRIVDSPEQFSAGDAAAIEKIKKESAGVWCHRCGYCNPCPQDIFINWVLTIEGFFKRFTLPNVISMAGENMEKARSCTECRECVKRCPYDLDIPALLKEKLAYWDKYLEEHNG
jgi:predicted aldo/keto reductase-like oxidoreductase